MLLRLMNSLFILALLLSVGPSISLADFSSSSELECAENERYYVTPNGTEVCLDVNTLTLEMIECLDQGLPLDCSEEIEWEEEFIKPRGEDEHVSRYADSFELKCAENERYYVTPNGTEVCLDVNTLTLEMIECLDQGLPLDCSEEIEWEDDYI